MKRSSKSIIHSNHHSNQQQHQQRRQKQQQEEEKDDDQEQHLLLKQKHSSEIELTSSNYPSFGTLSNNKTSKLQLPKMSDNNNNHHNHNHNKNNNRSIMKSKNNTNNDHYQGWKLTIPAPSYYNHEKYDSTCIELYSCSNNNVNSTNNNSHGKQYSSIPNGPFVKIPSLKMTSSSTNNNDTSAASTTTSTSTSTSIPNTPKTAWIYQAPTITNWKISSQTLLSITYKQSIYATPYYTNQHICYDYLNRCSSTICCSKTNNNHNHNDNHKNDNHKNDNIIYQERYTEKDIIHVQSLDNIQIMGFTGGCKAIQIHFRRLSQQHYDDSQTHKQQKQQHHHHNLHKEQNLKMKLQPYIDRSTSMNYKSLPYYNDSMSLLQNNGYGIDNDYGLPLPPWDDRNHYDHDVEDNHNGGGDGHGGSSGQYDIFYDHHTNSRDENDNDDNDSENGNDKDNHNSKRVYGPILTFAIPNVLDDNQMDPSSSSAASSIGRNILQDSAPLLWKIEFPPDPTIAIEAFTVLDGVLDVHPSEYEIVDTTTTTNNNEDDDNDNHSTTSSCSTCSKDECDACHPTNIYINGYQSWSFTGSVKQGEEQPKSAMPDFLSKAFNYGADVPPYPHVYLSNNNSDNNNRSSGGSNFVNNRSRSSISSSNKAQKKCNEPLRLENYDEEYFPFHEAIHYTSDFYTCISSVDVETSHYKSLDGDCNGPLRKSFNQKSETKLDEMGGTAMVLGFLSQRKQFGLITFDADLERVAMHASMQGVIASRPGGLSTDWAYCQILASHVYDEEPLAYYLTAVSSYNNSKPLQKHPPLTGWCSWYHYYENIDLLTLNANFEKMSGLKETISQDLAIVDDGYITAWGDWTSLKPKEFPEECGGMKALADNIRANKMIPGLWMAPFACDKHSKIAKEHPDWIIRNDEGRIANSANCGKFFYGLDATNPDVREFAFNSVRRAVKEWGYECLKLDFLYAACLHGNGKYDLSMSRAETMYLALQTLRAAAGPDTFLIGCGCPLGPAIGYMDGMRISADTGPTWYPDFPLPWWDHATLPSLRAMIRNSTTRACLGHRWWHNDPDCVLLGETTSLSDNEVVSAASIVAMTGKNISNTSHHAQ